MAKKKSDKETEPKKVSTKRFSAFLKNETTHFVIGLISVIFAVYLLLAFTSFFFTGAADQSILDNQQPGELMQTANHVKNYAGARGAQLAEFLINECFGLAAYFIILFLAVVGMKLMKAYQFRIWKWFMSCSILLIWFSITLGFIFDGTFGDSFIYPGGLHGHNVSNWLISQIGIPGLGLLLFIAALLFFIYLSNETILVIRKALRPSFRRKKKEDQTISATEENPIKEAPRKEESRKEFSNPGPAIVDFELEQPTKKEEEVEEQVPFPFESKQVTEPAVIEEPAYTNEEEEVENTDEPDFSISEETNEEDEAYKGPVLPPYNPRLDLENYKFPSLDLLNEYEDDGPNIDMEEQNANKDRIIKVLRSFGIEISSIKASVGPTITLYEITPAEGVRISKIRNLEDDIALSLSALGIRIIAPIPGKGTIGIEVPNANPRIVPMKSILNTIATALADESWDYVSVQQASHFSGKQATYEPYMSEVLDFVRKHVRTDTKIMFHMTWAYSKDSNHGAFPDYGKDQMRMYNEIIAATQAADKIAKFDIIIPSGTAIQNARTSKLGDTLNRDGYHLQLTYGRYTAACTWYEAILGKSVVGNSYAPSTMSELEKRIAQEAAHAAVLKPYSITDLSQISQICVPALEWSGILAEY